MILGEIIAIFCLNRFHMAVGIRGYPAGKIFGTKVSNFAEARKIWFLLLILKEQNIFYMRR